MGRNPRNQPVAPRHTLPLADLFSPCLWVFWTLSVVATAIWVAWPALWGAAPLAILRLVVTSALVGVVGLLALTVVEIRLAPWRFLD